MVTHQLHGYNWAILSLQGKVRLVLVGLSIVSGVLTRRTGLKLFLQASSGYKAIGCRKGKPAETTTTSSINAGTGDIDSYCIRNGAIGATLWIFTQKALQGGIEWVYLKTTKARKTVRNFW